MSGPPVIDMHAHLGVAAAAALVAGTEGLAAEAAAEARAHSAASLAVNQAQLARVLPRLASVPDRLADMDAQGVDVQLVGPMPMHHYWAPPELGARFARATNEGIAEHCAAAPGRLFGLGTVPLQDPATAVAELRHAVRSLGLYGISVSTDVAGRELSDPSLDPVWAQAAELSAIVFIHPWGCSLGERLASRYLGNTVGQPVETTVALSRLIFDGVLDRHPGLRLLAAHGGGYLPYYAGRSDHAWRVRPDARGCASAPSSYLRRIWFDGLVHDPAVLRTLVEVAGPDRVVLGTDYPFDMGTTDPLGDLDAAALPPAARLAVASANALALLEGVRR